MTLTDFASIGSFISGIGVLISLVYLSLQIRQNTLSHRATATQSWLEFTREENRVAADPAVIALRARVDAGDDTLTDADLQRYMALEIGWFVGNMHLVWLHRNRILDDDQFYGGEIVMRTKLRDPATRATWELFKTLSAPRFRSVVEGYLASEHVGPLQDGYSSRSLMAVWREEWKQARRRRDAAPATRDATP